MGGLEKEITAMWKGSTAFELHSASGHTALTDGDSQQAMSPMELLLGALVGCSAADVTSILQKKKQNLSNLEVRAHGLRCEAHPRVYTDIHLTFVVTGHQMEPAAVERALELTKTKYCSVSAMLAERATLVFDYEIREADSVPASGLAG